MFTAHRCKRGYEVAKERAENTKSNAQKRYWLAIAEIWMTRWKYLESQGLLNVNRPY